MLILKIVSIINYFSVKKKYKKIIFLHIPHCGGNTIHKFLKFNFGGRGKKINVHLKKELETIDSSKLEIKEAVEKIFKVKVKSINTIKIKGKTKIFKGTKGKRSDYKKAVITLKQGENLDYSGGVN